MATSQDGLDPTSAKSPEAFMLLLREARAASGLSIVEIVERARQRGYDLDPIELSRALEATTLPSWQIVTGILTAGGMGGLQIDRWMRTYHELAAPAQPVTAAVPVAAAPEPSDVEPVSVPPLVLKSGSGMAPRRLAVVVGALATLVLVPLLLVALLDDEDGTVATDATSAPSTSGVAPAPSAPPVVVTPSPTPQPAVPTTPAPVKTTKPPTRTTAPAAPPGVLRSGVVSLTGRHGFDLDSGQTQGERDIYRWNGDTLARTNGSMLEPMSSMPSKQACQAERGWEAWVSDLEAGQWLCVRTSDGRYGRLNITDVGGTLRLAYTIWT